MNAASLKAPLQLSASRAPSSAASPAHGAGPPKPAATRNETLFTVAHVRTASTSVVTVLVGVVTVADCDDVAVVVAVVPGVVEPDVVSVRPMLTVTVDVCDDVPVDGWVAEAVDVPDVVRVDAAVVVRVDAAVDVAVEVADVDRVADAVVEAVEVAVVGHVAQPKGQALSMTMLPKVSPQPNVGIRNVEHCGGSRLPAHSRTAVWEAVELRVEDGVEVSELEAVAVSDVDWVEVAVDVADRVAVALAVLLAVEVRVLVGVDEAVELRVLVAELVTVLVGVETTVAWQLPHSAGHTSNTLSVMTTSWHWEAWSRLQSCGSGVRPLWQLLAPRAGTMGAVASTAARARAASAGRMIGGGRHELRAVRERPGPPSILPKGVRRSFKTSYECNRRPRDPTVYLCPPCVIT